MLLQRSTKRHGPSGGQSLLASLLLCAVLLAGCGVMPGKQHAGDAAAKAGPDGAGGQVEAPVVPSRARTLYEQAVAVMAAGDFVEAQLRFQEFLLQYTIYPGAHVNLAIIYASNGDDIAAGNSITDALMIDPEHPAALNQFGMLLRRQGKFPAAESAYLKAITADPEYALAHYNLGVLNELYLQRLDVALHHYENYQSLRAEDKQVRKWIVDLRRRVGATQRSANVTE